MGFCEVVLWVLRCLGLLDGIFFFGRCCGIGGFLSFFWVNSFWLNDVFDCRVSEVFTGLFDAFDGFFTFKMVSDSF